MTPPRSLNERSNSVFATALAVGAVLIGLLLIADHQGPTNRVLQEFLSLDLWGAGFITAGVLGLAGQGTRRRSLIVTGHGAGAVLAAFVAGCFWVADGASLHGFGVYLNVSVLQFLVAWISRPPR